MKEIDYSAVSTVWILPWRTGAAAQQTEGLHKIPFSEAITVLLGLPPEQQKRASIEIHGKPGRIETDEAVAISQRPDFPRA